MSTQQINQLESSFHFLGEYCELKVIFKEKKTNAPVQVVNPQFIIKKDNNPITLRTLVPLSPTGIKTGEYKTSFLSTGLTTGIHDLTFTGFYPDEKAEKNRIEITSSFQIFEVDGVQTLLMMLRTQLHDHRPKLYWLDATDEYKWEDKDLYNALQFSVNAWNSTPPVSYQNSLATIDSHPFVGMLLQGAEYFAIQQKYVIENWNKLSYSDDTTLNIDRTGGLMQLLQTLQQTWLENMKLTKKDYVLRVQGVPKGIKSIRIPTRALMNLSLTPAFSFLSNGGY
jgi:hypothetical protein